MHRTISVRYMRQNFDYSESSSQIGDEILRANCMSICTVQPMRLPFATEGHPVHLFTSRFYRGRNLRIHGLIGSAVHSAQQRRVVETSEY